MKIVTDKSSIKLLTNQNSKTNPLLFNNNKGIAAFNLLKSGAIALGIAAIFGSAMALALDRIETAGAFTNGSAAENIVRNGTEGILQMFTLLPTQGIILGIVVLIGIVLLIKTGKN